MTFKNTSEDYGWYDDTDPRQTKDDNPAVGKTRVATTWKFKIGGKVDGDKGAEIESQVEEIVPHIGLHNSVTVNIKHHFNCIIRLTDFVIENIDAIEDVIQFTIIRLK